MAETEFSGAPQAGRSVQIELQWTEKELSPTGHRVVDCCLTGILLNGAGKAIRTDPELCCVNAQNRSSTGGAVRYIGRRTGEERSFSECIEVAMDRLSAEAAMLAFTVNINGAARRGQDLSNLQSCSLRAVDAASGAELCVAELPAEEGVEGLLAASLYQQDGQWHFYTPLRPIHEASDYQTVATLFGAGEPAAAQNAGKKKHTGLIVTLAVLFVLLAAAAAYWFAVRPMLSSGSKPAAWLEALETPAPTATTEADMGVEIAIDPDEFAAVSEEQDEDLEQTAEADAIPAEAAAPAENREAGIEPAMNEVAEEPDVSPAEVAEATVTPEPTPEPQAAPAQNTNNPENGILFNRFADTSVELTITNNGTKDAYLRLYHDKSGVVAQTIYVRAGSSIKVNSPQGTYRVQLATGHTWQDEDTLFGSETVRYTADETIVLLWGQESFLVLADAPEGFQQTAVWEG